MGSYTCMGLPRVHRKRFTIHPCLSRSGSFSFFKTMGWGAEFFSVVGVECCRAAFFFFAKGCRSALLSSAAGSGAVFFFLFGCGLFAFFCSVGGCGAAFCSSVGRGCRDELEEGIPSSQHVSATLLNVLTVNQCSEVNSLKRMWVLVIYPQRI